MTIRLRFSYPLTVLLLSIGTLAGCKGSDHVVVPTDGDADVDADSDSDSDSDGDDDRLIVELSQAGNVKVDILFVIDNSNSMLAEQDVLARQMQLMADELIAPRFVGEETPPSVEDLHVGIISPDMGTHGYTLETCRNPMNGDNGALWNVGHMEGCQPSYSASDCSRAECPWLTHSTEMPDDGTDPSNPPIWEDFACISSLGSMGCGFEQPLEASLVALTTQTEPGRPNEGFLRDDSILTIVYFTDEDDCSTPNGELFNPTRDDFGPMNVRCALNPTELYPVERYYEALMDLRPGSEDLLIVTAIAGIPIDGSWNPGDSIEALRDLERVNPSNPNELAPTCMTGQGLAHPPVRIADLVYRFGDNGILASICVSDLTSALQAITRKIQSKLGGPCLPVEINWSGTACRVVETLVDERECPQLADTPDRGRTEGWHADLEIGDDGRRMCEILPADYDGNMCPDGITELECEMGEYGPGSGALQGWFHTGVDSLCEYGQILFTSREIIGDSSEVYLECEATE